MVLRLVLVVVLLLGLLLAAHWLAFVALWVSSAVLEIWTMEPVREAVAGGTRGGDGRPEDGAVGGEIPRQSAEALAAVAPALWAMPSTVRRMRSPMRSCMPG